MQTRMMSRRSVSTRSMTYNKPNFIAYVSATPVKKQYNTRNKGVYEQGKYVEDYDNDTDAYKASDPDYEPFDLEKHKAMLRGSSMQIVEEEEEEDNISDTDSEYEEEDEEEDEEEEPIENAWTSIRSAWNFRDRKITFAGAVHDLISFLVFYAIGKWHNSLYSNNIKKEADDLYARVFESLKTQANNIKAGAYVSKQEIANLILAAESYTKKGLSIASNSVLDFKNEAYEVLNRLKKHGQQNNNKNNTNFVSNNNIDFEKGEFIHENNRENIVKYVHFIQIKNPEDRKAYENLFEALYNNALEVKNGNRVSENKMNNMKDVAQLFGRDLKYAKRAYHALGMLRKYGNM